MNRWRTQTENWLASEEHDDDAARDAAFAHVFAALPAVEVPGGFVQRAVDAAWLARARRRRTIAWAGVTASGLLAVLVGMTLYGMFSMAGGWLLTATATAVVRSLVSSLLVATTAVEWWSATARAGSAIGAIMAMPQGAAAVLSVWLVALAALYALHRLLRAEFRFRDPGPLCL